MNEAMKMDVNETAETVKFLTNTLAQCAIQLYEMAEDDISFEIETAAGKKLELFLRENRDYKEDTQ